MAEATAMASHTRPRAAQAGYRTLETWERFQNEMMILREDRLALPGGKEMAYAYVERGPAVIVVPVTAGGEIVLIRQYRYPVDEFCLEVPAGTARDARDLSLQEVAAKELCEEVGASCEQLERIGSFFSNSSMTDEECHIFLGTGAVLLREPKPEPSEKIEIVLKSAPDALELARAGQMRTGPAALAVLLAEMHFRRLGFS
jgi:ADP-ribose pyrophosphatase